MEQIKFNRYETDNKINQLFKLRPSVEARLVVMSLSKQEQIDEFVAELDNEIQQLEDYETPYEIEVNEIVLENLNDETILEIQKQYINEQIDNIFKMIKSDGKLRLAAAGRAVHSGGFGTFGLARCGPLKRLGTLDVDRAVPRLHPTSRCPT